MGGGVPRGAGGVVSDFLFNPELVVLSRPIDVDGPSHIASNAPALSIFISCVGYRIKGTPLGCQHDPATGRTRKCTHETARLPN
jgi:hypothetical protein